MPSQILSFLFLGSRVDAKDKESLKKLGIKFILNCTPSKNLDPDTGCPNYYEKERLFVYKRIPVFDNKGEDITAHMESAVKFIDESKFHGNILVHCHKGISRSASIVIGYLVKRMEFTFDEALVFCQTIRPIVQPNTAFIEQLKVLTTENPSSSASDVLTTKSAVAGPQMPFCQEYEEIEKVVSTSCNSGSEEVAIAVSGSGCACNDKIRRSSVRYFFMWSTSQAHRSNDSFFLKSR
jgi:protein-tyrosine phosphatase